MGFGEHDGGSFVELLGACVADPQQVIPGETREGRVAGVERVDLHACTQRSLHLEGLGFRGETGSLGLALHTGQPAFGSLIKQHTVTFDNPI